MEFLHKLYTEIKHASNIIIDCTTHDTIVIFIGQSANLLYHAIKDKRQCFELPFSGIYNITGKDYKERCNYIDKYNKVICQCGITKDMGTKKIYLIDYSVTGGSINSVSYLLNKYFGIFRKYEIIYWSIYNDCIYFSDALSIIRLNNLIDIYYLPELANFEDIFGIRTISKLLFQNNDIVIRNPTDRYDVNEFIDNFLKQLQTVQ